MSYKKQRMNFKQSTLDSLCTLPWCRYFPLNKRCIIYKLFLHATVADKESQLHERWFSFLDELNQLSNRFFQKKLLIFLTDCLIAPTHKQLVKTPYHTIAGYILLLRHTCVPRNWTWKDPLNTVPTTLSFHWPYGLMKYCSSTTSTTAFIHDVGVT